MSFPGEYEYLVPKIKVLQIGQKKTKGPNFLEHDFD
jgi:hypothetical protein